MVVSIIALALLLALTLVLVLCFPGASERLTRMLDSVYALSMGRTLPADGTEGIAVAAGARGGTSKMIRPQDLKLEQEDALCLAGSVESASEESRRGGQPTGPDLAPDIEVIIHKYSLSLRLYLNAELGCEDAVEEVLQRTWIALYLQGLKSGVAWLHSPAIFSWLKRVAHNRACDYRKQRRDVSLDAEEVAGALEQRSDPFDLPETMSMRDETALEILDVILRTFAPGDAFLMLCFHYLEYSTRELAPMLGCPESTIKSRLRRSRERLGRALQERGIDERDIERLGGLKERLDQVLAWLALDAVPGEEWDSGIVRSILRQKSEHPSWEFIAFDFLGQWDRGVAERYQMCSSLASPRRTLRGTGASFRGQRKDQVQGKP